MISCRKHVLGDLRPYVCTYPDCDLLEHFFDNREEWYKHETQQHRVKWFCNILGHPQYSERTDFLTHMSRDHDTTFKDSQLTLLPSMFQCPSRSQDGICNLCTRSCTKLKSHVSRHLQQIALFALPRVNETEELNSESTGQNVNSLANVNRLQDGSRGSLSSHSASKSELSQPTHTQELQQEGPEIDDPIDQVTVPDTLKANADEDWPSLLEAAPSTVYAIGRCFIAAQSENAETIVQKRYSSMYASSYDIYLLTLRARNKEQKEAKMKARDSLPLQPGPVISKQFWSITLLSDSRPSMKPKTNWQR
jgi:hypothetical protein